jgi:hypothetical protein
VTRSRRRAPPQTIFSLARQTGLLDRLCRKQRLALFLAGLCHDLEHPGVSPGFLLRSRSRMAAWYKDDPGLLERHHSIRAFELLAARDSRLLASLPTHDRVNVRHLVRDLILATDMARHAAIMAEVDERSPPCAPGESGPERPPAPGDAAPPPPPPAAPAAPAAAPAPAAGLAPGGGAPVGSPPWGAGAGAGGGRPSRLLLHMQVLLKCADISNVAKPLPVAMEWAVAVSDEFFAQGDRERRQGIEARAAALRSRPRPSLSPRCGLSPAPTHFSLGHTSTHPTPPASPPALSISDTLPPLTLSISETASKRGSHQCLLCRSFSLSRLSLPLPIFRFTLPAPSS